MRAMDSFRTHNGKIIEGEQLRQALYDVANDWLALSYGIRAEDHYASHVTEEQKNQNVKEGIETARRIRDGQEIGLWCLQRLNTKLTGECIALFSK